VIGIDVLDDVLPDPHAYRAAVLARAYQTFDLGGSVFHGIALGLDATLPSLIERLHPTWRPTLTFARRSPHGQVEPNYVHTDRSMGDWTALLYLTPDPPAGDGTVFWRHRESGAVAAGADEDTQAWRQTDRFEPWRHVEARFNRLLIFPGPYYHSRAIPENYGTETDARLIQVVFGVSR
jgi:hypothetical protein